MNKPIKRHIAIQPLSRDHHHGLLLCWKIRTGFSKGIAPERIKKYVDWFYETYAEPHFKAEETHIFPILGNDHKLIKKAMSEHRLLRKLFKEQNDPEKSLSLLEENLDNHIRFEERILFNEIQDTASPEQLETIQQLELDHQFVENTEDEFWV